MEAFALLLFTFTVGGIIVAELPAPRAWSWQGPWNSMEWFKLDPATSLRLSPTFPLLLSFVVVDDHNTVGPMLDVASP